MCVVFQWFVFCKWCLYSPPVTQAFQNPCVGVSKVIIVKDLSSCFTQISAAADFCMACSLLFRQGRPSSFLRHIFAVQLWKTKTEVTLPLSLLSCLSLSTVGCLLRENWWEKVVWICGVIYKGSPTPLPTTRGSLLTAQSSTDRRSWALGFPPSSCSGYLLCLFSGIFSSRSHTQHYRSMPYLSAPALSAPRETLGQGGLSLGSGRFGFFSN